MEKTAASKIMAMSVAEFEVSPTLALPTAAADGEYVELLEVTIILSVYIWNKKQSYSVQQANLFNTVNIIRMLKVLQWILSQLNDTSSYALNCSS